MRRAYCGMREITADESIAQSLGSLSVCKRPPSPLIFTFSACVPITCDNEHNEEAQGHSHSAHRSHADACRSARRGTWPALSV